MFPSVRLQNFKGVTGTFQFGTGNLLIGLNAAGKSAIAQAIRAAVLGYVPEPGISKDTGLKMFADEFPMNVGIDLPSHSPAHIGFTLDRVKSTVKMTADNTLATLSTIDDATRVLFDPTVFFGLTDSARVSKACELVRTEGGSPDAIDDAVAKALGLTFDGDGIPNGPEDLVDSFERWRRDVKARAATINDLLANSENFWKGEKSLATAAKQRAQKSAEFTADITAIEKEVAALPPAHEIDAKLKQLREEMRSITEKISREQANRNAAAKLNAQLTNRRERAAKLDEHRATLAKLNAEFEEANKTLALQKEKVESASKQLTELRKQAPKREEVAAAPVRTDSFRENAAPGRYRVEIEVVVDTGEPLRVLPDIDTVTRWQEVREANSDEVERFQAALYAHEEAIDNLVAGLETDTALQTQLERSLRELNNKKLATESLVRQAEEAQSDLATPGQTIELMQDADFAALSERQTVLRQQEQQFDADQRKVWTFEADKKRIADAAQQREEADARLKLITAVCNLLAEKKQEVVSLSIATPLAVANKLGAGILRGQLVFEDGEIGMRVGAKFFSCRTFSGMESTIVVTGLCAGLAARTKLRVLIIDEVARIGESKLPTFFQNLDRLVSDGDIDQWIAISPDNSAVEQAAKSAAVPSIITIGDAVAA